MSDTPKDEATERGDELLRRLLKSPPKPHKPSPKPAKDAKPKEGGQSKAGAKPQ